MFLGLLDLWKTIRETPSTLDGLFALDDEHGRDKADGVRRDFSDPTISARLVLTGIRAVRGEQRSAMFQLVVHDTADWYEWYELGVDWTPKGWRIVAISRPAV